MIKKSVIFKVGFFMYQLFNYNNSSNKHNQHSLFIRLFILVGFCLKVLKSLIYRGLEKSKSEQNKYLDQKKPESY
jgi:hypothetical protein